MMRRGVFVACMLLVLVVAAATTAQARLTHYPLNNRTASSNARAYTGINGISPVVATDGIQGYQLWRTDGTPLGTSQLSPVAPGPGANGFSMQPNTRFASTDASRVYFVGTRSDVGSELFRASLKTGDVDLMYDACPGTGSGMATDSTALTVLSTGRVVFAASDCSGHQDLFVSLQGIPGDTVLLKDFGTSVAADVTEMTSLGTTACFTAFTASGRNVWRTDGTTGENNTRLLVPTNATAPVKASGLVRSGRLVYFAAFSSISASEPTLYYSNCDDEVAQVSFDSPATSPRMLTPFLTASSGVMFQAKASSGDYQLWVVGLAPGTGFGTQKVVRPRSFLVPNSATSGTDTTAELVVVSQLSSAALAFAALTPPPPSPQLRGLFAITFAGVELDPALITVVPPGVLTGISNLCALGAASIVFQGTNAAGGAELWTATGTANGYRMIADIYPGAVGSLPRFISNVKPGLVAFTANTLMRGTELYLYTEGAGGGSTTGLQLMDLNTVSSDTGIDDVALVPGTNVLVADAIVNGTTDKRIFIADLANPGSEATDYAALPLLTSAFALTPQTPLDNRAAAVLLPGTDATSSMPPNEEVWQVTPAGSIVALTNNPLGSADPENLYVYSRSVFGSFLSPGGLSTGQEPAQLFDGSTEPRPMGDLYTSTSGSMPGNWVGLHGYIFFTASNSTVGTELWRSVTKADTTISASVLVADINPGSGAGIASVPVRCQDKIFFAGTQGSETELWMADEFGAQRAIDVFPGSASSNPTSLVCTGDESGLYFVATVAASVQQVVYYSLAANTTVPLPTNGAAANSNPQTLVTLNDLALFVATGPSGVAPFGGNASGATWPLAGGATAVQFSAEGVFHAIQTAYAQATSAAAGTELFQTDGYTLMVADDLFPGATGSSVQAATFRRLNDSRLALVASPGGQQGLFIKCAGCLGEPCIDTSQCQPSVNVSCSNNRCLVAGTGPCQTDFDCASGFCATDGLCCAVACLGSGLGCSSGGCQLPLGASCFRNEQCFSGHCAGDGKCCLEDCEFGVCGTGQFCININGGACLAGSSCLSGICSSDGVCCNSDCEGKCANCTTGFCNLDCSAFNGNPNSNAAAGRVAAAAAVWALWAMLAAIAAVIVY